MKTLVTALRIIAIFCLIFAFAAASAANLAGMFGCFMAALLFWGISCAIAESIR